MDLGKTATFNLISNILQALDSKKLVAEIFCDLTKAFGRVRHEILLAKLSFMVYKEYFLN
jgi:hypothetical protein